MPPRRDPGRTGSAPAARSPPPGPGASDAGARPPVAPAPGWRAVAAGDAPRSPRRAARVVAEEADASGLFGAGLGLGHVVEEGGHPERLPPRELAAQWLDEMLA